MKLGDAGARLLALALEQEVIRNSPDVIAAAKPRSKCSALVLF
jgi:hypothetical protein